MALQKRSEKMLNIISFPISSICLKPTIQTLEKDVKYITVNSKDIRTISLTLFSVTLSLILNRFHTFFSIFLLTLNKGTNGSGVSEKSALNFRKS